jgi:hypothetical protein
MGAVEFGSKRKARKVWLLLACGAFFFMTLPLIYDMAQGGLGGILTGNSAIPAVVGLIVAPMIVIAAYFLDCTRMYLYAALFMFAIPHSDFMYDYVGRPANALMTFGVAGLLILIYGSVLLSDFIRKYPLPATEVSHVDR